MRIANHNSWIVLSGMMAWWSLAVTAAAQPTFTNVTSFSGIDHVQGPPLNPFSSPTPTVHSGGAAAGDFDRDGWVDLFVTRSNNADILYRNLGNGRFTDVTVAAFGSQMVNTVTNGAACGDIDNDDDLDLYVTVIGQPKHLLYINQGDGTFREEADARGAAVGDGAQLLFGTSVAMGDYDLDGYLDVYATEWRPASPEPLKSVLLHNQGTRGPGTFTDETQVAGASLAVTAGPMAGASVSFAPRFTDLDGDRYPDLAITSDGGTTRLFWNNADLQAPGFADGTVAAGVNTGSSDMGSAVGDINADGLLDWFITDIHNSAAGSGNRLFVNNGNRRFTDQAAQAGVINADWGWGTAMFDYDNDGDLDLTATNGFVFFGGDYFTDRTRLWQNDGTGSFTERGASSGVTDTGQGRGLLTFDYDHDGDLDIFIVNNGDQPILYRNDGNRNHFLRVDTVGIESNRDGIGAFIRVAPDLSKPAGFMVWEVNAGSHFLAQSEFTAHFGLGQTTTADQITITWPSGLQQRLAEIPADTFVTAFETPGDYNADGLVDELDYDLWVLTNGQTVTPWTGADGNGDGVVDEADYVLWFDHLGWVAYTVTPVPEPATVALFSVVASGWVARARRKISCSKD